MLKRLWICIVFWPLFAWAQEADQMTWFDNRFRVDPTIKQMSLVIKRMAETESAILVAPDGTKYYASHHPQHITWYREQDLDIISIDNPMPGPWQAIGQISSENQIRMLSNIHLTSDQLPSNLYQAEVIKFSAVLQQNELPLVDRDYLERLKLQVLFYPFMPEQAEDAQPISPIVVGTFADDGLDRDEKAGDGVFTVSLPIDVEPGKYRVVIRSGNRIYTRTIEQEVLVYPTPLSVTLLQSYDDQHPHQLAVLPQDDTLVAGSLAAHIRYRSPKAPRQVIQQAGGNNEEGLMISLPNDGVSGQYSWGGWIYATDRVYQRHLIFPYADSHFASFNEIHIDQESEAIDMAALERKAMQEAHALQQASRKQTVWIIVVGNGVMIMVLLSAWWGWRRWKQRRKDKQDDLILPS